MIHLETIECKKEQEKHAFHLPFFTWQGWAVIFAGSALGGLIGGMMYGALMAPFCAK